MFVLVFGVAGVPLILVAVVAGFASWHVARDQALKEAERSTRRLADLVIAPLLGPALRGDLERADELERTIDARMKDEDLTEVTVWTRDGRIAYSDDPSLIGQHANPPEEVARAIDQGERSSGFEREPEADPSTGATTGEQYVEVYAPLRLDGQALAFEAYYDYTRVETTARGLARGFIPLVLAPLLALQFIQIPIAISLARRVRAYEANHARLLENTLAASEQERSRVAADLHDGPIQDIAGISYAFGAIAHSVAPDRMALMTEVQRTVQHAIESLRRLMVDLYPPDLDTTRLPETLSNLTVPLQEGGIEVETEFGELPELSNEAVTTLYRVTRESLLNVAEHSQASNLLLSLHAVDGSSRSPAAVQLIISDDGVGLDPSRLDRRAEGHLGLRLLRDRVESAGGTLTVAQPLGGGTLIQVDLPVSGVTAAVG